MLDTISKEVVDNHIKIGITRSNTERFDVAVCELGNTAAAFGTGGLLSWLMGKFYKKAMTPGVNPVARNWAVFGRSAALFAAISAFMWAMPYIRNYITAWKTGSLKFTEVIGADKFKRGENKQAVQTAMDDYAQRAWKLLAIGGGIAGAVLLGTRLAIVKKAGLGILNTLFKNKRLNGHLLLKDGSFTDFAGTKAVLFWGIPSFGGWIQASRDGFEKKEQALRLGAFIVSYTGPQYLARRYFESKFKPLLPAGVESTYKSISEALAREASPILQQNLKKAMGTWKKRTLWGLLASFAMQSTLPQLINIMLTKQRVTRSKAIAHAQRTAATPRGNLSY